MFEDNIITEEETSKGMLEGISRITSRIRRAYGGAGKNIMVESKLFPYFQTTNDAETIVQAVKIKNKAQKFGALVLKELCGKQDKTSGNGRKTSLIIAEEILKAGYASTMDKNQLCRELKALIPFIENEIDKQTTKITVDNVLGVATTASESEEIGKLLQEIYPQIGKNGILTIEGSGTYETSYKITNGIRFEMTGMLSPEMVHDEEAVKDKRKETKAVYEKPLILVTKKKITIDDDINPLLSEMIQSDKRDLVIFTNDMDSNVASMLVELHKRKPSGDMMYGQSTKLNVLIVKAPTMWQDYVFEDFAKCVGATIVEDKTGLNFKNLKLEHLGTCDKIEVDTEDTILTGIKDITEHCKELHAKGDDDSLLRLSWLATKSALLKLGATNHQELALKRLKANDSNRSTYLALQHGVVKGGGLCLYDIGKNMYFERPKNGLTTGFKLNQTEADKILYKALKAPLEQAMENYGLNYDSYSKLITEDIVDSAMVIKRAVKNAVGIASTILTSDSIIYLPDLIPEEIALQASNRQQNPFNQ